ncbi:anhydro-N-acetylmuramic acid kinase [Sabulilitoribacter multivorans]|uniref:Anhydro-N-acetylmuramic acid kinase n=1 Tax=Flaviramulus multivorans TaxID=1304750 RepID=A0ABS9IKS6_9FLAO|nr:anhydro-N-acetylmuramic acid kinase [Flaviramulus multivorans]MCF7561216.1 anhydro-N-acetylmuramic acid kinase [Flaviramulus multivorans]
MIKTEYNVIGVMSGTSLDGIDLVFVNFKVDNSWQFEIIHSETVSYGSTWFETLRGLVSSPIEKLERIDDDYTRHLATIIKNFIKKNNIQQIDAICSHGHTALHQPENKLTYQIGNKPLLAELLKETVVCDFRVQDVELGGQGAPLVPVGDLLLFSEYDYCLNLGGFANISTEINKERIAYDICPVNIVLNYYVKKLGLDYDDEGNISATGSINQNLLGQLNALPFYKENYPKSLGLEWVSKHIFALINSYNLDVKDVLRTVVEHMSIQIATEINKKNKGNVLITGGGVYNTYLINRIKAHSNQTIVIPKNEVIEYKEALIFGLLGVLKLRNEINCLRSVTGAKKNHSSGKIYLP